MVSLEAADNTQEDVTQGTPLRARSRPSGLRECSPLLGRGRRTWRVCPSSTPSLVARAGVVAGESGTLSMLRHLCTREAQARSRVIGVWPRRPGFALGAGRPQEGRELLRREQAYRERRPFPEITGKVVIIVDDGLATGSSLRAVIEALGRLQPACLRGIRQHQASGLWQREPTASDQPANDTGEATRNPYDDRPGTLTIVWAAAPGARAVSDAI